MHGAVFLDADGQVIRPAILWNDQRTAAECAEIEQRVGAGRLRQIAGNPALTGFQAPKVLWLEHHEPAAHARVRHLLLPKDFVRYRLTGGLATDASDAAGTLLLDLAARDWSDEILAALAIPRAWLPPVHEGPEVTGKVSSRGGACHGPARGAAGGRGRRRQCRGRGRLGRGPAGQRPGLARHLGRRVRRPAPGSRSTRAAPCTRSATPCPASTI